MSRHLLSLPCTLAPCTQRVPTTSLLGSIQLAPLYPHLPFCAGYYEAVHNFHRRQLAPDELRLVSAAAGRA